MTPTQADGLEAAEICKTEFLAIQGKAKKYSSSFTHACTHNTTHTCTHAHAIFAEATAALKAELAKKEAQLTLAEANLQIATVPNRLSRAQTQTPKIYPGVSLLPDTRSRAHAHK